MHKQSTQNSQASSIQKKTKLPPFAIMSQLYHCENKTVFSASR